MKKAVRELLKAVQPLALVAPSYDIRLDKKQDSEVISIGHWFATSEGGPVIEFSAIMKLTLEDFRKVSRAFTKLQRKTKKKSK